MGQHRLLLIEDDDRIARLLQRALHEESFQVDRAGTGQGGLDCAAADPFDLVILDLMLPDLDGMTVLNELVRQRPARPVLVLSAVPQIATRVACIEAGAADFLAKPFALAELVARVRARIRERSPGPVTDQLTAGPVRLDLRLHRVTTLGREAMLSYREFVLLRYLMQRAGLACSRADLLRDVWGMSFDPGSNVVDVYVRRLRAKLDNPDRIVAVRHVGYSFDAG
jgi:DNA-binding response OmpR family regulator